MGFVPIENAIEGTVSATIDGLIHDVDLHIQREVVMDIHLHLMAPPGTALATSAGSSSYPHALAQCQKYLARDAAGEPSRSRPTRRPTPPGSSGRQAVATRRAIAPRLAAERYGLVILAEDVEDHPDNQTRFVLVARTRVPKPTGHDKTSIVCFQRADHPGQPARHPRDSSRRATST